MSPSRQALHSNPIRTKRRTGERGGGGGPHSSLHTLVPPCPTFNIMTQPTPVRTGSAGPREGRLSLTLIWYYSIFMKSCPIKSWRCKNFFFPHCFLLSHNNTNNQMIDWSRCSSAFHISLYQIEITFFLLSSRVGALCACQVGDCVPFFITHTHPTLGIWHHCSTGVDPPATCPLFPSQSLWERLSAPANSTHCLPV